MAKCSQLLCTAPSWQEDFGRLPAAAEIKGWLLEPLSLTERLVRTFGPVRVALLRQGVGRLFREEAVLIGHWLGWVREVVLWSHGRPLLAARTVGPKRLGILFADQGEKPLGERLFTDPEIERLAMSWSQLKPLVWSARDLPCPHWGRRGLYSVHGDPLFVAEFFLWL